ncbi:CU044_2847 family protein [Dactylosporangium cerinum]|uniref:CU044_2847 family protein n=1 Tax=Dactylosporangium cerinum TaxID=1434730 RepID=A0ABV9W706_9ACTN
MSEAAVAEGVVVQVVELTGGREISWGDGTVERLRDRLSDVQSAIVAGVRAVAANVTPDLSGWEVAELQAKFGVTLNAEAGVVVSRATTGATFEVTVTLRRKPDAEPAAEAGQSG